MKAPKVKAFIVKVANHDHWALPTDAESYERMVEQTAQKICGMLGYANWKTASTTWKEIWRHKARSYLRAIGITAPKRTKKGRK